jgi:hypothetical protein
MKLFEIDAMFQKCCDDVNTYADEHDNQVDPCLQQKFDALAITRDAAIEQWLRWSKNLQAEHDAVSMEMSKMDNRLRSITSRSEWVKSCLARVVGAGVKMSFPIGVISWRKSEAVEFVDVQAIPAKYRHQKIEETISKTEIRDDIKAGIEVPGAKIVGKQNIQIR